MLSAPLTWNWYRNVPCIVWKSKTGMQLLDFSSARAFMQEQSPKATGVSHLVHFE
jgi:hypothetical protein